LNNCRIKKNQISHAQAQKAIGTAKGLQHFSICSRSLGRSKKGLAVSYDNPLFDTTPHYGSSSFGQSVGAEATEMRETTRNSDTSIDMGGGFSNRAYDDPPIQNFGEAEPTYAVPEPRGSRSRMKKE